MSPPFDVAVAGGGPAGVAAALGSARLGYTVALISRGHSTSIEGLSERTVLRLREAGLDGCIPAAVTPVPRLACWAAERAARGRELPVQRQAFDAALLRAASGCVRVIPATVSGFRFDQDSWQIATSEGPYRARIVLDARGRRVRRSDDRGPALVAWSALLDDSNRDRRSAVVALRDGWCWLARMGDGRVFVQFVSSPGRKFTVLRLQEVVTELAIAAPQFELNAARIDPETLVARAAIARHARPSRGAGFVRIGDAAVAMDPLSGNGVFEALGSARVAVAAVHSYLTGTDWRTVAQFVDERAAEIWRRATTAAGALYRREHSSSGGGFWAGAATAYERISSQATPRRSAAAGFELRPVLKGDRIRLRRVWVNAEWPRGVWRVNGRELAQAPELIAAIPRRDVNSGQHEVSDEG